MASNHVILVLFCGEIWEALSTAIPQTTPVNRRNAYTSVKSPTEGKAPLYRVQTPGLDLHISGRAVTVTSFPQFPTTSAEPSDSSWAAALLIGIILVSMTLAIIVILLWKCCRRPVVVDSNWAGRSPFADGDTPDVFMDSDQATKRSSVLFMLPWKWKQDSHPQHNVTAPESTTGSPTSPLPPPAADCSAANIPVCTTDAAPAPTREAASCVQDSSPRLVASLESPDLPPPPDWLRESPEDPSPALSQTQELHSEAGEQLPSPPEFLMQETDKPLPQLPQPEHPW
ncbi:protein EVI2B [Cuculus canorus]|uniref:protein EVI2B n=1 Tax=Cuculus canorus TaxID=55661 RepID=UPI00051AED7D|nr:protein EVI2B [Cuculus canorus]XP_053941410.1 protein EVI2B [Cuculus canorus]XP_053941411.1 protein EVI2B [Cuculus canorus]XP_053941412.1 protein EVI2B [Cuculus canorus]XP_053941414.1 protein EVI2B [Cuculus canorus]XP_053941415.1 protein EVI2B [Cuculus canorus]